MPTTGIFVDARDVDEVQILDQCRCGQEYAMDMRLRKECGPCGLKWLYPPDGVKPVPMFTRFVVWLRKKTRTK